MAFPESFWSLIRQYFCVVGPKAPPISDLKTLREFVESRASHVTQTSLYGYLRTRAGSRYPDLFANDAFLVAINAAKWNVWTACVSDLTVYAGVVIANAGIHGEEVCARVMNRIVEDILGSTGTPAGADVAFPRLAAELRHRVQSCRWHEARHNEPVFTESPDALVRWAPVMEELKQLDADIVRNSVRFRWVEVRQEFRRLLDVEGVLASANALEQAPVYPK